MRVFRRLVKDFRPYWRLFLLGLLGTLIYAVVDGLMYRYLQPMIDKGFVGRDQDFLMWVPFFILGIFSLRGVGSFLATYCMGKVGRSVVMQYRNAMLHKFMHLPMVFFDNSSYGELVSKVNYDAEQVAEAITGAINYTLRGILTAISLLVVLFSINWKITLILLLAVPILFFFIKNASIYMRRYSTRIQNTMGNITHIAEEVISGQRIIRTFAGIDREKQRIIKATDSNRSQEIKLILVNAISIPLLQLIGACAMAALVYYALNTPGLILSPGDFTAMAATMLALLRPIKQIALMNSSLQRGIAAATSIFGLIDRPSEIDNGSIELTNPQGDLQIQNVSFSYDLSTKVLDDVSFVVPVGKTVALVGRSGSGKSTLTALISRFYEISAGNISIDNCNITDLTLNNLRHQVAIVNQQTILFNDTVANNIAYGCNSTASLAAIEQAASAAHVMEFVVNLPQGLNTIIGENGVKLSGGQKQRIAIARAILKDAPILILDEATSSLDNESEKLIQQALEELMQNRTTLVIAHRLSTIEQADNIIVLDCGKVIESGSHEELLALGGIYTLLQQSEFQPSHNRANKNLTDDLLPED